VWRFVDHPSHHPPAGYGVTPGLDHARDPLRLGGHLLPRGGGPPGVTREALEQRYDGAESLLGGGAVALVGGERGARDERVRDGGEAGRGGVVGRVLRPADETLGVVGRVEEPAAAVGEAVEGAVEQRGRVVEPLLVAGDL